MLELGLGIVLPPGPAFATLGATTCGVRSIHVTMAAPIAAETIPMLGGPIAEIEPTATMQVGAAVLVRSESEAARSSVYDQVLVVYYNSTNLRIIEASRATVDEGREYDRRIEQADRRALRTGGVIYVAAPTAIAAEAVIPRGFASAEQFAQANAELRAALEASGVTDATIGVRGSAVTGKSFRTGAPFGPASDIDFYVESEQLTSSLQTSSRIPGFVHPDRVAAAFPELAAWAKNWSGILGRDVSVGGFVPGKVP